MTTELKRMRQLIGSSADWVANDLVIGDGEIAVERGAPVPTLRVGDGVKRFSELPTLGADFVSVIYGDGVSSSVADIAAANAAGNTIIFQGLQVVDTPTTITVPIADTLNQIFAPGAQVTIANGLPVRPEWFGLTAGCIMRAANALPLKGGDLILVHGVYPPSYNTFTAAKFNAGTNVAGVDYLAKRNVRILGAKLPTFKAGFTGLEDGTIIQGPFYAHADGFAIDLVGVDSGVTVTDALYAGVAQEGLVIGQVSAVAPSFMKNVQIGSVRGIARGPAEPVHGLLIEAITEGSIKFAEGACAFHGAVVKSNHMRIQYIGGYKTTGESVIFKSDSYAPMNNLQVDEVYCQNDPAASADPGFGLLIDAVTSPGSVIQIGKVHAAAKAVGVCVRSNGAAMTDVRIGSAITAGCPVGIQFSGDIRRVRIDDADLIACTTAGVVHDAAVSSPSVSIGSLKVTNAPDAIRLSGKLSVDSATFENISGFCVNYQHVDARLVLGTKRFGPSVAGFWNQQQPLTGTWVAEGSAGSLPLIISALAGKVTLTGWVKGGASAALYTLTTQTRPGSNKVFKAAGMNGANEVTVTVRVNAATGAITIPDFALAPTYISLDGIEWDAL